MHIIRSAIAGILALFVASAAIAQTFPTVPSQSVIGRLGTPGTTGPSQAIPFSTLAPALNKMLPVRTIYANDYGAKCNGGGDDSAAFQAAINAAQTLAVPLKFRGAACVVMSTLNITDSLDMSGEFESSVLYSGNPSINLLVINTNRPVHLHDFNMNYTAASNAGMAAVTVTAPSGENGGSVFERIHIGNNASVGINYLRSSAFHLLHSTVVGLNTAVIVANGNVADSGDSTISGNQFQAGAGGTAIVYNSSGGLRVINNKINGGGLTYGIQMALAPGASTADLFITGNSIEGISSTGSGVWFGRAGTTGGFGVVNITGNELSGGNCVNVPTDPNGAWLLNVSITGNTCILPNSASAVAYSIDSTTGLSISGNTVQSFNAGSKMFAIGSGVTKCSVGLNSPWGVGFATDTFASGACIVNLQGLDSGATGTLAYFSGVGQLSQLGSANNGVVVTSGAGLTSVTVPTAPLSVSSSVLGCSTCVTSAGSLTLNQLMIGGGGKASSTIATGTNVNSALGVNVGSAGSFVVNGGALGTPSSGVATNLTGTAAGLTAGAVTTNANLTGPVTSVGNATTIGANQVSRANEAQGVARSVIGVAGNATANVADIQGSTAFTVLGVNGAGNGLAFQSTRQMLTPILLATLPSATTVFSCAGALATENAVQCIAPIGGTFRNLYFGVNAAPGGAQTDIATLRVNGSDTSVTCTITGAATSCSDTTHTATITAGQAWSIRIVSSATASAMNPTGGIEFDNP